MQRRAVPARRVFADVFPALLGALLAGCVVTAVALGAFSKTTSNSGNTITAATVAPASGLGSSTSCQTGSAISFVAANSAIGTTTATVTKPTGTGTGDVMIGSIQFRGGAGVTITPPSGWTLVRRDADSSSNVSSAVYWKQAGAVEPASYDFVTTATRIVGGIATYRNADTPTPINASGTAQGNSAAASAPSITTTVANTRLLAVAAVRQNSFTAMPTGMTQRWNQNSGGGASALSGAGADQAFVGPAATGAKAFTNGSSNWVAQSVAVEPTRTPRVSLSWTASTSPFATGYVLERYVGATLDATFNIPSLATTSYNDDTGTDGTAYTYRLYAVYGSWRSTQASASATAPSC